MAAIGTELRKYLNRLSDDDFEMNIPYMYVDTVGAITVGVGHNISSHNDISSLPFVVKRLKRKAVKSGDVGTPIGNSQSINRTATLEEKRGDYEFLKKHTGLGQYGPKQLAAYTTLEMRNQDIDRLFEKDLSDAITIAKRNFPDFNTYPVPCQAALIDIAFNCGSFSSFHTIRAVTSGTGQYAKKTWAERWKVAAQNCRRGAVSLSRNQEVARWFLQGAAEMQKKGTS